MIPPGALPNCVLTRNGKLFAHKEPHRGPPIHARQTKSWLGAAAGALS